jgi:hypothetical protein
MSARHSSPRRPPTRLPIRKFGLGSLALLQATLIAVALGAHAGSTSAPPVKPPLSGLLDRHHFPAKGYTGAIRNFVVNTTWAQLQPKQNGPIERPNEIDRAITQAREAGMHLKLRVRAGVDSPSWAKALDGPSVTVYNPDSHRAMTIGRFWTANYGAAYADLQTKLAALYDEVPEVSETVVTRCQTVYSETYLRQGSDAKSMPNLQSAGLTLEADKTCHDEQMDAHRVWVHTRSGIAFSPYQAMQSDGRSKIDEAYTEAQMDRCRMVLGERCSLENNSIRSSGPRTSAAGEMFRKMARMGGAISLQTATYSRIGDYRAALDWSESIGAASVELPNGYTNWSPATLTNYASVLGRNG